MAGNLEDVMRALGEQLAGEGRTRAERSWRRFLASDREAALLSEQLDERRSEILRIDPPPPELLPHWGDDTRCAMWAKAGDPELMDLSCELDRRWREFDPDGCPPLPVEGFSEDEVDDVSYELLLTRLPRPGEHA